MLNMEANKAREITNNNEKPSKKVDEKEVLRNIYKLIEEKSKKGKSKLFYKGYFSWEIEIELHSQGYVVNKNNINYAAIMGRENLIEW